jgi:hypothetical protein
MVEVLLNAAVEPTAGAKGLVTEREAGTVPAAAHGNRWVAD